MINLSLGGACPRRPLTYVLPRAMMRPGYSADPAIDKCDIGTVAANGSLHETITHLMNVAIRSRKPWLLATFADRASNVCEQLILLRPYEGKLLITPVAPYITRPGSTLFLVAADRSCAFMANAAGTLVECAVPPASCIAAGVKRGWSKVRRLMKKEVEGNNFRHRSWEVFIEPVNVGVH
ncbi:hypothetical protein [Erythrobacter sp.]|uniref:hypothetical protein n=1 Tax=Erythrobacter sp. TaxID=1042 RepID=UPI0025FFF46A|nr:hypothetical protein [Erythrobacter sp.]